MSVGDVVAGAGVGISGKREESDMKESRVVLVGALGLTALLIVLAGCSSDETEMAETVADTATEAAVAPVPEDVFEPVERWQTITITGVVESVNLGSRELAVRGPAGNVVVMTADEQVERLDEVEVGDKIVVDYFVSLAADVREPTPEEEATPFVVLDTEVRAPASAPPGVGALTMIQAVVTVEEIDRPTQTVTIKGPLGNYLIIDVVDPKRLEMLKIGDKALMTYTEALAISLEKATGE